MNILLRTDSSNPAFKTLVQQLDIELAIRDGADHSFYAQYNKIDHIKFVVILYTNDIAVGCGALKEYAPGIIEVKRMFTLLEYRGKGLASQILTELEQWAKEMSYGKCILETGIAQPEAIALYNKCGYTVISNYGQYAGVEKSICFEKDI